MKKPKRFAPRVKFEGTANPIAVMVVREKGGFVTFEDHEVALRDAEPHFSRHERSIMALETAVESSALAWEKNRNVHNRARKVAYMAALRIVKNIDYM